jgi:hypothetical protein
MGLSIKSGWRHAMTPSSSEISKLLNGGFVVLKRREHMLVRSNLPWTFSSPIGPQVIDHGKSGSLIQTDRSISVSLRRIVMIDIDDHESSTSQV